MDTINVNARDVFVPTEYGNAEAEKPVKFHVQFLTVEDQAEVEYFEWVPSAKGGRTKIVVNSADIFRRTVTKVEGVEGVETAEQYLKMRGPKKYAAMMREEAEYIRKAMEIDEKN